VERIAIRFSPFAKRQNFLFAAFRQIALRSSPFSPNGFLSLAFWFLPNRDFGRAALQRRVEAALNEKGLQPRITAARSRRPPRKFIFAISRISVRDSERRAYSVVNNGQLKAKSQKPKANGEWQMANRARAPPPCKITSWLSAAEVTQTKRAERLLQTTRARRQGISGCWARSNARYASN
jgi:hypothetical protein